MQLFRVRSKKRDNFNEPEAERFPAISPVEKQFIDVPFVRRDLSRFPRRRYLAPPPPGFDADVSRN